MKSSIQHSEFLQFVGPLWKTLHIAGPCGAESAEQLLAVAKALAADGRTSLMRAGVWKPRTRPGAFEGEGETALQWLADVKKETGMRTTVEVATAEHVELALKYGVDVLWIGARTTVNPFSVQEIADAVAGTGIPVMVKNPVHPDLALWLGALERLHRAGITKLAAVHRGFHTAIKTNYRNAPLWEIPIELQATVPELPVICDPSHIAGTRELIPQVAQKAMDLNMAGLMIEVHPDPDAAKSDAQQQFTPTRYFELLNDLLYRDVSAAHPEFESDLKALREVIDGIDEELLHMLARRQEVVAQIGTIKKKHGVTILQLERWIEILQTRGDTGQMLKIDKDIIVALCEVLHKASIRKQNEVMNNPHAETGVAQYK